VNAFKASLWSRRGVFRVATLGLGTMSMLLATGCASEDASPPPLSEHYKDQAGWSLSYPSGMHLERAEVNFKVSVHEVTVASFALRRAIRSGSTAKSDWFAVDPPRPVDGPFPSDGIAFRVYRQEGGPPVRIRDAPETHFPLRLSQLAPDPYLKQRPRPLSRQVSAAGQRYVVYAWSGPKASSRARAELEAVVASLAFPHL
jgi:hypothetical protein